MRKMEAYESDGFPRWIELFKQKKQSKKESEEEVPLFI